MENIENEKNKNLINQLTNSIAKIQGKDVNIYTTSPKMQTSNGFVMLFYEAVNEIIMTGKLGLTEIKVVLAICRIAEYGNLISLNQTKLAEYLKMDKGNLSKSINKLIKNNVLIKHDLGLFFNPNLIIKGKLDKINNDIWNSALELTGQKSPLTKIAKKQIQEMKKLYRDKHGQEPDENLFIH
jgi:hypothetical protein